MNNARSATRHLLLASVVLVVAGCGTHSRFASQLATPKGPIAVEATVDGQLYEATDRLFYVTPIDSLAYRLDEEEQEDPEVYGKFY